MLNRKLFKFVSVSYLICLIHCSDASHSDKSPAEFSFWTVGSSNINVRFGTNIYAALDSLRANTGQLDEFLFTIAEEPLTMDQIRKRSGLSLSQVEYFVTNLDSCNFIKKFDQQRWATTLPIVTDNQMKIIRQDLAAMANSVAQFLEKQAHKIQTFYDKEKSSQDPPWEDVSHLIIDKFIIDGTFHSNLNKLKRESDVIEPGKAKKRVMPAFLLHRGENFLNFGCNWYEFKEGENQREIFVLHGAVLDRYDISMNKYRRNQHFSAGLFNISPDGALDSLLDGQKEMLRDLEWISGERLLVPIVKAGTLRNLFPLMENIGRDAANVAYAKFTDLTDSYNRSSYSKFIDNKEDYIQVLIHSLFGLTIEQLVKSGTVSQVPKPVPESFGVYIVFGRVY